MSESKDVTDKTGAAGARKPLSLKRTVESGHVQQKFSHGRSKSVVVEKRKKRTLGGAEVEESPVVAPRAEPPQQRPQQRSQASDNARPNPQAKQPTAHGALSDRERAARAQALAAAQVREAETDRQQAEREHRDAVEREHREELERQQAAEPEVGAEDDAARPVEADGQQPEIGRAHV